MPRFEHDCENCIYLDEYTCSLYGECDLYYCANGGMPDTVIARYGNEGHEYTSGIAFVGMVPSITEAYERALARGIDVQCRIDDKHRAKNESVLREHQNAHG